MSRLAIGAALLLLVSAPRSGAQPNPMVDENPVATDTVVIKTALGPIAIELYGKDAPRAVENFLALIQSGFYRGLAFHRIVPGFVIQAGDPSTRDSALRSEWGRGGRSSFGDPFADELNPNAPSYKRGYVEGTLAMANRGPNTNTSQFFIVMNDDTKLQKLYTIFGKVVAGMDVAHAIERLELADMRAGLPRQPAIIADITVEHVLPAVTAPKPPVPPPGPRVRRH